MPTETIETLIIGGGQAGLTMSHMLTKCRRPHLVVERHRIAERWRSDRWEGLRFQGPNWTVRLPDFPYPHTDPDAYASCQDIVDFLVAYAGFIAAPIRCGVEVRRLRRQEGRFVAETTDGMIAAANVVVATGGFQDPVFPALSLADPDILQLHASRYRRPDQLPDGGVLIVGGGNSGTQIAEELLRAGRRVFLSIGRHRRVPRQYRGRNLHWWMGPPLGMYDTPPEQRGPDRSPMVMSGAYGGHTIDYRRLAGQGMVVLGRVEAVQDDLVRIAPDLRENLARGDAAYLAFLDAADAYVRRTGLDLPEDPEARAIPPAPPALSDAPIRSLDLRAAGVTSVIWATGYRLDFGWIDAAVFDAGGMPVHDRGVTAVPGLYFLGLQFLSRFGSSFLEGVGHDAARLADHLATRSGTAYRTAGA